MTPRQRILITLRGGQADRVPYDITPYGNGLAGFNRQAALLFRERTGSDDPDAYFGVERDIVWIFAKETRIDLAERYLPYHQLEYGLIYSPVWQGKSDPKHRTFSLDEWGTALVAGDEGSYDYFIPPARMVSANSLKDFEQYPLPDFDAEYRHAHLSEEIKSIHARDLTSVGFLAMTIFEMAWQIRGMDQLLIDLMINQEWAECLLDRLTEQSLFRARKFAAAGVDVIHIGDDVGMQDRMLISPDTWRKWLKPRLARIISEAREIRSSILFFYHSDGFIEPIIPDLIEIGINALNPVQPECMDPAKIKERYGNHLTFWGTMGIQKTLPFGTPQDVEAEVKKRIETVGKGGGLYLSPTHVIAPEVPHENLRAFVEAAKKYGKYE